MTNTGEKIKCLATSNEQRAKRPLRVTSHELRVKSKSKNSLSGCANYLLEKNYLSCLSVLFATRCPSLTWVTLTLSIVLSSLLANSLLVTESVAGNFNSPAVTTDSASKMYTVDDIYNRLNAGTPGTNPNSKNSFAEPASTPASSSKDLNDVMGKAPAVDDTDGATTAEVAKDKKFWSLQSGNWGLKTGTATITTNPAIVPKTGQTICYETAGSVIACAGTGQDGELQKGVTHASPRFTKNVNTANDNGAGGGTASNGICDGAETCNGTVTDNSTGLIWLLNANCANAKRNWETAFTDIASLNAAGTMNAADCGDISETSGVATHQTDWRLPNIKELLSLVDYQNSMGSNGLPAVPTGHPFTNLQTNDWYWSSTTFVDSTNGAWVVDYSSGNDVGGNKGNSSYVWAVRSG